MSVMDPKAGLTSVARARPASESWSRCFFSTLYPEATLPELLALAQRFRMDGLELRLGARHAHGVEVCTSGGQRRHIRALFDQCGVALASLASPIRIGKSSVEELSAVAELARALGSAVFRVFIDDPRPGEDDRRWRLRIHTAWQRALWVANGGGATMVVENHGGTSGLLQLGSLDLPRLELAWDVAHSAAAGEHWRTSLQYAQSRLAHVHIKDWKRTEVGWDRDVELFHGDLELHDLLGALSLGNYQGFVSLELHQQVDQAALARFARAVS